MNLCFPGLGITTIHLIAENKQEPLEGLSQRQLLWASPLLPSLPSEMQSAEPLVPALKSIG